MKKVLIVGMTKEEAEGLFTQAGELGVITEIHKDPLKAFSYAVDNHVDAAFIRIECGSISGIEVGKWLRRMYPKIYIVFISSTNAHAYEAITVTRCNGYMLEPLNPEMVQKELEEYLKKNDKERSLDDKKRLVVRCFGNFEMFYDDKPIAFSYSKSKELFAYLVDRCGSFCTNAEILSTLWEDERDHTSYLKRIKADLQLFFQSHGLGDVLVIRHGGIAVNIHSIYCDYYNWKEGITGGGNEFLGEYMEQYSWAETTKGSM